MDQALTVKTVSEVMNVHPMTVYRLIEAKRLKAFRTGIQNHGGGLRVLASDLEAFMRNQPNDQIKVSV